jgi:Phosphatidylglycerophosphate synthase
MLAASCARTPILWPGARVRYTRAMGMTCPTPDRFPPLGRARGWCWPFSFCRALCRLDGTDAVRSGSVTDYLDGNLARKWGQVTKLGTMLDPIADKAMVVLALAVVLALNGAMPVLLVPVAIILFREVFVSGLREFLGDTAGTLAVTKLAKWKTTVQMLAIALLFAWGLFDHYFYMQVLGMDPGIVGGILSGEIADDVGLNWKRWGLLITSNGGILLLWAAALLTLVTGIDYYRKARPHLQEGP